MLDLFEQEKPPFTPSKAFIQYRKASNQFEKEAVLTKVLRTYKLSASHLNTFLECQYSFLMQCFLKVKFPPNKAMLKGTIVHSVLDWYFKEYKTSYQYPEEDAIVSQLRKTLKHESEKVSVYLTEEECKETEVLTLNYIGEKKNSWNMIAITEFYIQKLVWNGIPLTGFIDKIEFDGNNIAIVDYKTGNVERAIANEKYKNQLLFYTILLENFKQEWYVELTQISTIGSSFIDKTYTFTDKEKAQMKTLITDVYSAITSFQFEKCKNESCFWCNKDSLY